MSNLSNRIDIGHGLTLQFTRGVSGSTVPTDVWLHFMAADGKAAGISVAAASEKHGPLVGRALRAWASDRIDEHMAALIADEDAQRERSDNGQFGVGA